jgi:hypothetical protein
MIRLFLSITLLLGSLLFLQDISVAKEKCKLKGRRFSCKYVVKWNRYKLTKWAISFCRNRGFQSRVTNRKFFDCTRNGKRCKKITGNCLPK